MTKKVKDNDTDDIRQQDDTAAKKTGKKSPTHATAKRVIGKIFQILISVVIVVALLGATLNFFGVPQRTLRAIKIDGKAYSVSELGCYYMLMYGQYRQMSSYYDSNYGEGYGKMLTQFDTTVSPENQTTTDDDGNTIKWSDKLMTLAIEQMTNVKRYYAAALEAKTELTSEDYDSIESNISSFDQYRQNYSRSAYLTVQYGKGVSEGLFRQILEEQQIVTDYQDKLQEDIKNGISDDDIGDVYNKDNTAYDVVDFRWFTIDVTSEEDTSSASTTTEEGSSDAAAKVPAAEAAKAQNIIDTIKQTKNYNEDTFKTVILGTLEKTDKNYATYQQDQATRLQKITKEKISSTVSADAASWLYEKDSAGKYVRATGDMAYFANSDGTTVYVLYALGTPYQNDTPKASVRHILCAYETTAAETESGETTTASAETTTVAAAVKEAASKEAESIYNEYESYINDNNDGKEDEDYFGELADTYSDDTASTTSGSSSSSSSSSTSTGGGKIADMSNDGSYVAEFENWTFDKKRKYGDVEIIETQYGYHIMFYVGGHDKPEWYETIQSDLVDEKWKTYQDDFDKKFGEDAVVKSDKLVAWTQKSCIKKIEQNLSYSSSN